MKSRIMFGALGAFAENYSSLKLKETILFKNFLGVFRTICLQSLSTFHLYMVFLS
jgi:hypothetical protein